MNTHTHTHTLHSVKSHFRLDVEEEEVNIHRSNTNKTIKNVCLLTVLNGEDLARNWYRWQSSGAPDEMSSWRMSEKENVCVQLHSLCVYVCMYIYSIYIDMYTDILYAAQHYEPFSSLVSFEMSRNYECCNASHWITVIKVFMNES